MAIVELVCPVCGYSFEIVHDYNCDDCPKCGKASYSWYDDWNYETEEEGCPGYYWDIHKNDT